MVKGGKSRCRGYIYFFFQRKGLEGSSILLRRRLELRRVIRRPACSSHRCVLGQSCVIPLSTWRPSVYNFLPLCSPSTTTPSVSHVLTPSYATCSLNPRHIENEIQLISQFPCSGLCSIHVRLTCFNCFGIMCWL